MIFKYFNRAFQFLQLDNFFSLDRFSGVVYSLKQIVLKKFLQLPKETYLRQ